MGKLLILSVPDHEEHILDKIMELIADEPEFIHLAPSPPQSALSFPGLEIRLKEQTVYCNGTLIALTYHEFAVLTYLARHPGWVFSAHQIYEAIWHKDGEHCVPSMIPGISLNCLRTSSIIEYAALDTDSIVKAEKRNGSIPPIRRPIIVV